MRQGPPSLDLAHSQHIQIVCIFTPIFNPDLNIVCKMEGGGEKNLNENLDLVGDHQCEGLENARSGQGSPARRGEKGVEAGWAGKYRYLNPILQKKKC